MSYRGKIRKIWWHREERINDAYQNSHDWHARYDSSILAYLYPSAYNRIPNEEMYVDITNDVLEYYDRQRISMNLIREVDEALRNVWIYYYYDEYNGEDYLKGNLSDYLD